jgi:hypothetical protein
MQKNKSILLVLIFFGISEGKSPFEYVTSWIGLIKKKTHQRDSAPKKKIKTKVKKQKSEYLPFLMGILPFFGIGLFGMGGSESLYSYFALPQPDASPFVQEFVKETLGVGNRFKYVKVDEDSLFAAEVVRSDTLFLGKVHRQFQSLERQKKELEKLNAKLIDEKSDAFHSLYQSEYQKDKKTFESLALSLKGILQHENGHAKRYAGEKIRLLCFAVPVLTYFGCKKLYALLQNRFPKIRKIISNLSPGVRNVCAGLCLFMINQHLITAFCRYEEHMADTHIDKEILDICGPCGGNHRTDSWVQKILFPIVYWRHPFLSKRKADKDNGEISPYKECADQADKNLPGNNTLPNIFAELAVPKNGTPRTEDSLVSLVTGYATDAWNFVASLFST